MNLIMVNSARHKCDDGMHILNFGIILVLEAKFSYIRGLQHLAEMLKSKH